MLRLGLIIIAFWPAIILAQNTFSLKEPNRAHFQSRELLFKEKYLQSIQKWEDVSFRPKSLLDENEIYLSWIARQYLLRDHSNQALEEFFDQEPTHPKRSSAYFFMGLESFRNKNYSSVSKYFEEVDVLQLSSAQSEEYFFKSGYSFMIGGFADEALSRFQNVKGKSTSYGPAAAYYSGYLEYQKGNYSKAKQDLLLASDDPGFSKTINDLLAVIYYKEGDVDKLIAFAEDLEKKGGKNAHIKNLDLLVGDAYFSKRKFARSWEYFSKTEPKNPGAVKPELAYRYGRTLFEIEDFEKAEKYLKIGVTKSKSDSLSQICAYYSGVNYFNLEDNASAALFFDKASEYNIYPGLKENATFNRAKIRINEGFISQSIEILEMYKKEFPSGTYLQDVNNLLAEAYLNSNRYLDGIKHIEKINSWEKKNRDAYQKLCFHYGSSHFNDRSFDSAIFYFEKSLKYPQNKQRLLAAYFWMAEAYSIKRDWKLAILNYGKLFQKDAKGSSEYYYNSRYGIAFAYFKSKKYVKASGHYTAYTNRYESRGGGKNYEDALLRLGDCHFVLRKYSDAYPLYKKIYNRGFKGRDYALFRLGEISWIEDKGNEAKRFFGKVLEQYPKSPYYDDALYERSTVSFEMGEYQNAVDGYGLVLIRFPRSIYIPNAYFKKGMSHMGMDQFGQATTDFREFLLRFPRNSNAEHVLSSLHEALNNAGRGDEFEKDKIAFQLANPESKALESIEFENGKESFLSGNYSNSIPMLTKFLRDYSLSSYGLEAANMLALSYDYSKQADSAFIYYQLVQAFGSSEYLKRALERSAIISRNKENYALALENFEGWFSLSSSPEEQTLAQEGLLICYYELEKYDSSLSLSRRISEIESPFGNRNQALLYWGKSLLKQGKLDEAKERFEITIDEASDENAAEAKYLISSIQYSLSEFRESIETCLELATAFNHYSYWNDQAYLLISDNFIGLDDLFQARATLESIIKNSPDQETVAKAREKLALVAEKEEALNEIIDTVE